VFLTGLKSLLIGADEDEDDDEDLEAVFLVLIVS
jgi:hypothetical protein